ncbi:MAG: nucleotidyltransferase domain-containing protein [Duncaniella sp.]|nr:nucleotidyltransferase domain-containing protein [Duncaniella sp.]
MKLIELNIDSIITLCKKYKVKVMYAFGSILTPRFRADSDVDLAVSFDKDRISLEEYADNFFGLQFELERLLKRDVDLVCYDAIKNPVFRREMDETKHKLYG